MYIYIFTYLHIFTNICIYIYTYNYTDIHIYIHIYANIHKYIHIVFFGEVVLNRNVKRCLGNKYSCLSSVGSHTWMIYVINDLDNPEIHKSSTTRWRNWRPPNIENGFLIDINIHQIKKLLWLFLISQERLLRPKVYHKFPYQSDHKIE